MVEEARIMMMGEFHTQLDASRTAENVSLGRNSASGDRCHWDSIPTNTFEGKLSMSSVYGEIRSRREWKWHKMDMERDKAFVNLIKHFGIEMRNPQVMRCALETKKGASR